jgi:hypothetical protein
MTNFVVCVGLDADFAAALYWYNEILVSEACRL